MDRRTDRKVGGVTTPNGTGPAATEPVDNTVGVSPATDSLHSNRRRRPSQIQRVRRMLEFGWTCGITFLDPPDGLGAILRYPSRIHELRKQGVVIVRRPCEHPWHDHRNPMWQWRAVGHVDDGQLPGIG